MRTTGTEAEIEAYLATCAKAVGYPTPGVEVGKGCHVSGRETRRSLGMRTVTGLDGKEHTYEAFETLHGAHVPFTTTAWDKPRKHPTKKLWDCEALDPVKVTERLSILEVAELEAKHAAAKEAGSDWTPVDLAVSP